MLWAYIQSFWFPSYHRFSRIGALKTGLFALWIMLVGVLVLNVYFMLKVRTHLPLFLASLPAITFSQGQMTAPAGKITVSVPDTPYQIILDSKADTPPSYQTFLDDKIMLFMGKSHFFVPSVSGVQSHPYDKTWNAQITPSWWQEKTKDISAVLQTMFFFASFLVLGSFLLGAYCMAAAVLFLWQGISRKRVALSVRLRWAVFLQGPVLTLWIVNLIFSVPLFLFAVFILLMMYSQQIYNTLPEEK